tara:strand:+ start:548 stop:1504 length:957 start_codon:yes stop_codon:yes gene_type:complete
MGQLPITSRLKRVPSVPSVLKATGTPKAKIIKKGDDKIVKNTKTITTPGSVKASDDQCKPGDTRASCIALSKMSQEEIEAAEVARGDRVLPSTSQITTESTEKGDDVIADTYSKRTGDVLTNFDGRQKGRATKFTNRYVRQSQNKLARADDRMAKFKNKNMKDGVFTAPEAGQKGFKKYSRLKNKQTENTNELADFKVGASNQAESMRTGKKIGSGNVRRDVDRQDTAGDQTPEQRIAQVAAENNITTASTGQASQAINVPSGTNSDKDQFNVGALDVTKFGEYTATTSPTPKRGYAMKGKNPAPAKSVLKKSYFKNK